MNEIIEQYENILNQIENRIIYLKSQLLVSTSLKEHDIICARVALLEKEEEELIQSIHEMKAR